MRVYFEEENSYVTCMDRRGKHEAITVKFDYENILDWYPLNISYELRYDSGVDTFFIAPREYSHPRKYGIEQRRREKATEVASFKCPDFYIKGVKEDNSKVLADAEYLNFPKLEDNPTMREVRDAHIKLTDVVEIPTIMAIESRAKESMDNRTWEKYYNSSEESQSAILHSYASESERAALKSTGGLRILLNIMRKRAEANGL